MSCNACMKAVDTIIPNHVKSIALAAFYLDRACTKLPTDMREKCQSWVKDNEETLVELVNNGQAAYTLCENMKLCGTEDFKTGECKSCKNTIHDVKMMLPKHLDINELAHIIDG
ncbi:hypothetical protein RCL1_000444 [Eukaryota sp. TZLM3-RCL]